MHQNSFMGLDVTTITRMTEQESRTPVKRVKATGLLREHMVSFKHLNDDRGR
jgi:hypothetical protein